MEKENLWNETFSMLKRIFADAQVGKLDVEKVHNATKTISLLKKVLFEKNPSEESKLVEYLCAYLTKRYASMNSKLKLSDDENREIRICNSLLSVLLGNSGSIQILEYPY